MAELAIQLSAGSVKSKAGSLSSALGSRWSDYSGIKNRINGVGTSRGYLNTASSYLQHKLNQLDEKKRNVESFKNNVANYVNHAIDVDKGVARRIKQDAKDLYKAVGIKTGFIAAACSFGKGAYEVLKFVGSVLKDAVVDPLVQGAQKLWGKVQEFYTEKVKPWWDNCALKYVLKTLLDVVVVVIAAVAFVAAFAISSPFWMVVGIIACGFALYKGLSSFVQDTVATNYAFQGKMDDAKAVSEIKTKDLFIGVGKKIDESLHLDNQLFEKIFSGTWYALTAVEIVYGGYKLVTGLKEVFTNKEGIKGIFKKLTGYEFKSNDASSYLVKNAKLLENGHVLYHGKEFSNISGFLIKENMEVIKGGHILYKGLEYSNLMQYLNFESFKTNYSTITGLFELADGLLSAKGAKDYIKQIGKPGSIGVKAWDLNNDIKETFGSDIKTVGLLIQKYSMYTPKLEVLGFPNLYTTIKHGQKAGSMIYQNYRKVNSQ